jgi:hypothetical protein
MKPTFRGVIVFGFVGMAIWVGYLHYRVDAVMTQAWRAAVQRDELTLSRLRAIEAPLQDGRVDDAALELQRTRKQTLSSLSLAAITRPNSNVRDFALRVFCSEMPAELPAPRNRGDEADDRRIRNTEQRCDRG